jgi:hypothetical protein
VPLVVELSQQFDKLLGAVQQRNRRIEQADHERGEQDARLASFSGNDVLEEELRQLRLKGAEEGQRVAQEEAALQKTVDEMELACKRLQSEEAGCSARNDALRRSIKRERGTAFDMLGGLREKKAALEEVLYETDGTTMVQLKGRRRTELNHARAEADKSALIRRKLLDTQVSDAPTCCTNTYCTIYTVLIHTAHCTHTYCKMYSYTLDPQREGHALTREQQAACRRAAELRMKNVSMNRWLPVLIHTAHCTHTYCTHTRWIHRSV